MGWGGGGGASKVVAVAGRDKIECVLKRKKIKF